jgi:hypothetical protein
MTQQVINIGTTPGDDTGDPAHTAFTKSNENFTELYAKGATEGIWNFQATSTDIATAPVSGRFKTNSGNYRDATQIAIHATTIQGIERDDTLRTLRIGDIIQCQDRSNGAAWCRFVVQALPVDNTTWFQINVALDSDGGAASGDNQEIIFTFTANISGGGGGGISDAPSDGVRYVRQNAAWASGDAAYATPAQVSLKADLASPTFTGDPKAPTPTTGDNDTSIATTAFVKAQSYLTGNQTITLSGDVTGAGATAITATIANNAITNAKLADMPTATLRGRVTAGTGDPEDLTGTQATTLLDVVTSALKGLAPASGGGTTNFLRADATWAAPAGGGTACGRLAYSSATLLTFTPFNGDRIKINGTIYPMPAAGIAGLGNTGVYVNGTAGQNLAASTTYYVYAFNNSGTVTADFSTTGHATSTTAGNVGTEIKSGDDTRSLIGMCRTNASSQFADTGKQRFVRSWFNRPPAQLNAPFTANSTFTTTTWAEVGGGNRTEFVCFADDRVQISHIGQYSHSLTTAWVAASIGLDGIATIVGIEVLSFPSQGAANFRISYSTTYYGYLADGYHFFVPVAASSTATATVYSGANATPAAIAPGLLGLIG